MSKLKNDGLDQYGAEPFEHQQFGTAGVEGVKTGVCHWSVSLCAGRGCRFTSWHPTPPEGHRLAQRLASQRTRCRLVDLSCRGVALNSLRALVRRRWSHHENTRNAFYGTCSQSAQRVLFQAPLSKQEITTHGVILLSNVNAIDS